jgi:hypothetical protein
MKLSGAAEARLAATRASNWLSVPLHHAHTTSPVKPGCAVIGIPACNGCDAQIPRIRIWHLSSCDGALVAGQLLGGSAASRPWRQSGSWPGTAGRVVIPAVAAIQLRTLAGWHRWDRARPGARAPGQWVGASSQSAWARETRVSRAPWQTTTGALMPTRSKPGGRTSAMSSSTQASRPQAQSPAGRPPRRQ